MTDYQPPAALATDLDGTLIPLDGDPQNVEDLRTLENELNRQLLYSTGRHFASVMDAMERDALPSPDWIICDVGTSIYHRGDDGKFALVEDYSAVLRDLIAPLPIEELRERLKAIDGIRVQEKEKLGPFKLSYYADASQLDALAAQVQASVDESRAPYSIISSIDPFNNDGLIDLLPSGVSKAYALAWWAKHEGLPHERIVFAGDSGNDLAALSAGYLAIVVANADRKVARAACEAHRKAGWRNRLLLATDRATSGVLEGCRWFGLAASGLTPSLKLGAIPIAANATSFRVWAPTHWEVAVGIGDGDSLKQHSLQRDGDGYYAGVIEGVSAGDRYRFVLPEGAFPDPASRYQPEGVHGPSEVIDSNAFAWTDEAWQGVAKRDLVIYELHLGAFTEEGTYRAAIERLPELVELGVTAIELLPVNQTPGKWNWGYDGVDLFAPRNTYGAPDDFKALVDAAHAHGLAVFLDVVYNHIGPEGNYLGQFGPYFNSSRATPWGDGVNYDGKRSRGVRDFVVGNAVYWLDEYHLDGLRLDAVHFMKDDSRPTILDEIRTAVTEFSRAAARQIHLIAETNAHDPVLLSPGPGRTEYDALWCDCLMHALYSIGAPADSMVDREYNGLPDLLAALEHGYVYHGSDFARAETPTDENRQFMESFITGLQTHDGVGNHPHGKRIHMVAGKDFQRAAAALTLLHPSIPQLFMGEESAVDAPFPFFADFEDRRLRRAVDRGREREYPQHMLADSVRPSAPEAFFSAKCYEASKQDAEMRDWYRRLIALRKCGLESGWLNAANLSVGYDESDQVVWMRYGDELIVRARLAGVAEGVETSAVSVDGRFGQASDANGGV